MKKTKRIVLLVLAVVVLLLAAYAGKTVLDLKNSAATEVQEEDSTRWAELTSDPLTLEGIADGSAKYASAAVNGSLNLVFNGIWSRQTDYFTVPGGSLTITGYGAAGHLLPDGYFIPLGALGGAIAGDGQAAARDGEKYPSGRRWPAAHSTSTTAPITSRPTARTTAASSPGWIRRPATG